MAPRSRSRLLTLAALVAALSLGGPDATLAEGGGRAHGPGEHGVPGGVLPGIGGGGASPGGVIGGGLAGGVGGPGGLGGPRLGGGAAGGGGALSPLSPNLIGADSFRRGASDRAAGGSLSPLGKERGDLRRAADDTRDEADGLKGRGRDAARELDRRSEVAKAKLLEKTEAAEGELGEVAELTQARGKQARALLEAHRDVLEPDEAGRPVVRGEILALSPTQAALKRAEAVGFRVQSEETFSELGLTRVVLIGPSGVAAVEALRRLRQLDPQGHYDLNHLYQESGEVGRTARAARAPASAADGGRGVRIGLVDGGVSPTQPTLAGAKVVQKGFAAGGPHASPHATAVASLMAGRAGAFRGAAPGATLYVADVYGTTPAGGSADAIAQGLAWLAKVGAPVINISLVGPPNALLEAAVKALVGRGHVVVAAVGNDGPAAPPLYPASYPGVVAVTGVDSRRRVLPEASRGPHVDFAAPGSEMAAAGVDGRFVAVRGTSFAAPLAAGLLARQLAAPDPQAARRAVAALGKQAIDLGQPGRDAIYGQGLVAAELRTAPGEVQARYALRGP